MNRLRFIILFAATLGLAGCDADDMLGPKNASVARITVTANVTTPLASFGDSVVLTPRVLDQHEKPVKNARLSWSVAPAGVLERDADGVYRAVGNGRAVIVVTIDPGETGVRPTGYWAAPIADSVVVEVQQRPARLALGSVDTAFFMLGALRKLHVEVTDARGNRMQDGPPPLTWRSADARVATVDSTGVVRSIGEGVAQISVTADQLSGSAIFTVNPRLSHTSCMVYALRRQPRESCVTLDFILHEREAGQ